jgi:hypothetical protein
MIPQGRAVSILIATALMHNLTVLTDERIFSSYGVSTLW